MQAKAPLFDREKNYVSMKEANIDLSRAKREALDNIYSLFKQNINSCNAKRRRQRRRTMKNNNRSN